jgi:hypothetical protein
MVASSAAKKAKLVTTLVAAGRRAQFSLLRIKLSK